MLVLSRKLGESIRIADDIEITIIRVGGRQVRLAIEAPSSIRIIRGELEQRPGDSSEVPSPTA